MRSVSRGFSLMELMIVVAIIGILAAIAFPSYGQYVLRANRTVGKTVLSQLAAQQESFFTDRKAYATSFEQLLGAGHGAEVFVTRDGKANRVRSNDTVYSVALAAYTAAGVANCSAAGAPTATQYVLVATPINAQAKDQKCGKICLASSGEKSASGTEPGDCWKR